MRELSSSLNRFLAFVQSKYCFEHFHLKKESNGYLLTVRQEDYDMSSESDRIFHVGVNFRCTCSPNWRNFLSILQFQTTFKRRQGDKIKNELRQLIDNYKTQ